MIDVGQFRTLIVRPVLESLGLRSRSAEELLIGTALQESGLRYVKQLGDGPALGVYQMEPATHTDIWKNFLAYKGDLSNKVLAHAAPHKTGIPPKEYLIGNLFYATAMTRVHYLRAPGKLPDAANVRAMAEYWKQYYNTPLGKGTVEEFINNYQKVNHA